MSGEARPIRANFPFARILHGYFFPGERFGPYEIPAQLGDGGMGEVYRARDLKLDREGAIKVLPSAVAQDRGRLARFEREAKALAPLNHSNIAQPGGDHESQSRRRDHNG